MYEKKRSIIDSTSDNNNSNDNTSNCNYTSTIKWWNN